MKILFKYTTRSRRDNFLRGFDSIVENLSDKENYHILISVDADDEKMQPLPILKGNYTYKVGKSKGKIDAINRDVNEFDYDWDIIVNMSDDMIFITKGFDDVIRSYFTDLDRSLLFFDGNRNDLITMSILGREYYNRDKYIYHPDYKSVYCDNEATDVAKMRGCLVTCQEHLFTHMHPAYNRAVFDAQYQYTESFYLEDSQTYTNRKLMNFGL